VCFTTSLTEKPRCRRIAVSDVALCVELHGARDGQRVRAQDSVGEPGRPRLVGLAAWPYAAQHRAGTAARSGIRVLRRVLCLTACLGRTVNVSKIHFLLATALMDMVLQSIVSVCLNCIFKPTDP